MGGTNISTAALEALSSGLRGKTIRPGESAYDAARRVYNGMIDRRPALIVRPAGVADVIRTVNFAREAKLDIAIRGGGHNVAGFGSCDHGVVIDLAGMKSVRVDPGRRSVRAEAGCTWGDLDHATNAFGMATPGGVISTTGIAGLTLGGGFGYLSRKYGLVCDNLLSADVVTADGRFLTASATENPDLFWALRGGGGNFGVVTSLEYRLHPVSTVIAGPIFYSLEKARDVLRVFNSYLKTAPEEFSAFFAFLVVPPAPPFPAALHNKTVCGVICCHVGEQEAADRAAEPLLDAAPPLFSHIGPVPYPMLNSLFDPLLPPGLHHYWKADYMLDLSERAIDVHLQYGPQIPNVTSAVHIYPVNGAVHRVGSAATAYSYRDAEFVHILAAIYPDSTPMPQGREWVRNYWSALHPLSAGGAYVNFLDADEGEERVAASYRSNYARLVEIKQRYDPDNLFHLNQNIRPLSASGTA
jgi:FAD/FMN-containing dehydrogenase